MSVTTFIKRNFWGKYAISLLHCVESWLMPRLINDEKAVIRYYKKKSGGKIVDLKNPKKFSEKLQCLGIKWDYDYVKEDQIAWYAAKVEAHKAANAAVFATLSEEQKTAYADLLAPKSLMFMHIPLTEVKAAYDEYVGNGRKDTENVKYVEGFDGETDEVVYCSRTDVDLFETVLEKGSTKALFYGHDHLNNFVLEYKGIRLSYGYSIDYLAYSGIDEQGYHRGCTIITCEPDGDATIKHENYYQDKYAPLYEKEIVNLEPYKAE